VDSPFKKQLIKTMQPFMNQAAVQPDPAIKDVATVGGTTHRFPGRPSFHATSKVISLVFASGCSLDSSSSIINL
jgi:hypothetical protein